MGNNTSVPRGIVFVSFDVLFFWQTPLIGYNFALNKDTAQLNFKHWTDIKQLMKFMDGLQSLQQFYMWNPI